MINRYKIADYAEGHVYYRKAKSGYTLSRLDQTARVDFRSPCLSPQNTEMRLL
jgi:hypothetical protein